MAKAKTEEKKPGIVVDRVVLDVSVLGRRLAYQLSRQGFLPDVFAVGGHDVFKSGVSLVVGDYVIGDVESRRAPHALDKMHHLAGASLGLQLWSYLAGDSHRVAALGGHRVPLDRRAGHDHFDEWRNVGRYVFYRIGQRLQHAR